MTVREYATNILLQGGWDVRGNGAPGMMLIFKPTASFRANTEYLISIDPLLVKSERVSQRFRVGSLPRVAEVSFAGDPPDTLQVRFSERVDTKVFAGLLELTTGGKAVPLSLLNPRVLDVIALKSTTALAPAVHTLTIKAGSKGPAFDSDYSGSAGSGAFTLTINPIDHKPSKEWKPNVSK